MYSSWLGQHLSIFAIESASRQALTFGQVSNVNGVGSMIFLTFIIRIAACNSKLFTVMTES